MLMILSVWSFTVGVFCLAFALGGWYFGKH